MSLLANALGLLLGLEVARLELDALCLETLLVGLGGAQRLAVRQEEIAGIAVLDFDGLAHLAELRHAFEQNDFHGRLLLAGFQELSLAGRRRDAIRPLTSKK